MAIMQVRMLSRCFGFRSTIGFSPDGAAEMEFVTIRCQLVSSRTPDINLSQVNLHFKFQLLYHLPLAGFKPPCNFRTLYSAQYKTIVDHGNNVGGCYP